jgi:hypothetical protein
VIILEILRNPGHLFQDPFRHSEKSADHRRRRSMLFALLHIQLPYVLEKLISSLQVRRRPWRLFILGRLAEYSSVGIQRVN